MQPKTLTMLFIVKRFQVFDCPTGHNIFWKSAKEIFGNGMVLLENQTRKMYYNCIENNLALFCQKTNRQNFPKINYEKKLCFPKCCPLNQAFNVDHMHCNKTTPVSFYQPEVFSVKNRTALSIVNISVSIEYFTLSVMQSQYCPRDHNFFYPSTKVNFLSDGNLFVDDGEVTTIYDRHFCIDNFYSHSQNEPFVSAFVCNNIPPLHTMYHSNLTQNTSKKRFGNKRCSVSLTDLHNFDQKLRMVYSVCGIISELFILITLIFYLAIPKLKNHQGHIVIANLVSIFITTGLLVNVCCST